MKYKFRDLGIQVFQVRICALALEKRNTGIFAEKVMEPDFFPTLNLPEVNFHKNVNNDGLSGITSSVNG